MISQLISNIKCENFLDNLGIVWSSYKKTTFEMSIGFGKKLFTKNGQSIMQYRAGPKLSTFLFAT